MAAPQPLVTEGSTLNCILQRSQATAQLNNADAAIKGATDTTVQVAFTGCVLLSPKLPSGGASKQQLRPVVGSLAGLGSETRGVDGLYAEYTFAGANNSTFPHQDERNGLATDECIAQISAKASMWCFEQWEAGQLLEWYIPPYDDATRVRQKKYAQRGVPAGTFWAELRPIQPFSALPSTEIMGKVVASIEKKENNPDYEREMAGSLLILEQVRLLSDAMARAGTQGAKDDILKKILRMEGDDEIGSALASIYAGMDEITKPRTERLVGIAVGPGQPGNFADVLLIPAGQRWAFVH